MVTPGQDLDLAVELLPVAALIRAGHRIRVGLGGHDAACFDRYGPPDETFTVKLGAALHARPTDPDLGIVSGRYCSQPALFEPRRRVATSTPDAQPSGAILRLKGERGSHMKRLMHGACHLPSAA